MSKKNVLVITPIFLFVFLLIIPGTSGFAQQVFGASVEYGLFPYVNLADPDSDTEGLEIQTDIKSVGLAFPLALQGGKIVIFNQLNYRRADFSFKNLPEGSTELEQAQSVNYTFFMIDSLSEKWSLVAVLTPGLASDFEADEITSNDFTLQAIFGFIRKYSPNFQLGFGLAYMRDFGRPIPLPFIYFDWKNGDRLSATGLVPTDMSLTYKFNPKIDLLLAMRFMGDRHHGNPDKYSAKNPQLEYSEGTISPALQVHFTKWLHVKIEAGYAFYRNFEFLDGDKTAESYDLEPTFYYRANLVFGM
jgi:hypothetical protein